MGQRQMSLKGTQSFSHLEGEIEKQITASPSQHFFTLKTDATWDFGPLKLSQTLALARKAGTVCVAWGS